MKNETEACFRERLLKDINRLCQVSDKLYFDSVKFEHIFQFYQRYRIVIHNRIEQSNEKEEGEVLRMDRHKVAAAFFCAILKANPIIRKPGADRFFERTVNIQLALLFSTLYIIDLFNISDDSNSTMDKKIFSRQFKLPKCKQSKSKNYITNFIMVIDDIQITHLDIDSELFKPNLLFVISHLFFILDAYSYQENRCITIESEFTTTMNHS